MVAMIMPNHNPMHHRLMCKSVQCKRRQWKKHHPFGAMHPVYGSEYGNGDGQMGGPLGCPGAGTYHEGTMGVANKTMPCWTRVHLCVRRCVTVPVIDRGPYVAGRFFDLTVATANATGYDGDPRTLIRYAVVR